MSYKKNNFEVKKIIRSQTVGPENDMKNSLNFSFISDFIRYFSTVVFSSIKISTSSLFNM